MNLLSGIFGYLLSFPLFWFIKCFKFFILGTLEVVYGMRLNLLFNYQFKSDEVIEVVSHIIGGIDYYLIGIVLLIFSFGVYEIFISKLDIRLKSEISHVLVTNSLEELKGKIIQVIIVALIVSLFKQVLTLEIEKSIDLVYVSGAILLIALSSYLMYAQSHLTEKKKDEDSQELKENQS